MANDRERQPEMDYYELRRRREQVLSQRAKQRPEWDTAPARRASARPAAKAPAGNVKQSVPGVDVFPPKQVVKPVQPKQAPLVRKPIQVTIPDEAELQQKRAAAAETAVQPAPVPPVEPEMPTMPEEPVIEIPEEMPAPTVEIPAADVADVPAEDVADIPEVAYGEEYEEEEVPYIDDENVDDEDMVDEEIGGNNPFTPFVKLAGSLSGKFGEWKAGRADKPKKKGLFGKKQPEEPAWDENAEDWTEDESYADEVYEEIPAAEETVTEQPAEDIAAEEPAEVIDEVPAADIEEEAIADIAEEIPAEEIAYDEPAAEEYADDGYYDEEIPEEQPKKKFSLKNLFSFGKKKQPEEDLLDEDFDGFEDFDEDEATVEEPEQAEETVPEEQEIAEEPVEETEAVEIAEPAPAEEAIADIPEEIPAADAIEAAVEFEETEAEDIPAEETDDMAGDDAEYEEWDDEPEAEEPKPKKGLFAFFRRGPKKGSDEALLELLGDDDDDEDWDDELDALDAPYSPEDDAERSYDDMNKENLVASQMAEGMGEKTLSRKERRELAERMAAEAAVQEPVAPVEEETFDEEVDEPTRAFKPVRANREPAPEAEDDYDSFEEEEEEPAPKKKGLFGRKNKKAIDEDELDDLLFDDEDEDDEPVSKKKSKKSRYDDDDDYDDDDYDDYDDDDDYDDYDDDDDYDDEDDEGGSIIGSFFKALFTIVLVLAAAVIVLNLLASRNVAPAKTAVNAIAGVLPESVSEIIFPDYEPETNGDLIIEATPAATNEVNE